MASANLFTASSTGNLNINTANAEAWYVNGKGIQVAGQTDDYGATSVRSTTVAAGSTDIGADEMTPSSTPPSATASPVSPAVGTQTFTFGGRTVASIFWNSGNLPTAVDAKYYSGVNPPNPGNNSPLTLNAYWSITATGGTVYDYGATLNYDDALLGTVSSEAIMRLSKTNATLNSWSSYTASVNTTANTLAVASGLTSFSNFSGSGNVALPIEFQSITATAKGSINVINFSTATEKDVKAFAIDRSVNNRTWEVIGTLAAIGGVKTTEYSFNDINPTTLSYYRVRSIETNGKDQISKIVAVKRNGGKLAVNIVSPVPTTEGVNVDFSTSKIGTLNVVITDIVGKVVKTERFTTVEGANLMRLNLSNLAQGSYILSLNDGETIATQRIVKQ